MAKDFGAMSGGNNEPEKKKSEWLYRCQAIGCCLSPSIIRGGQQLCTFHSGQNPGEGMRHWQAISDAIKQNESLIKKSFSLVYKPTEFWAKHTAQLRGWDFCPMGENEWPSQYTTRLLRKVEKVVYQEASEIIEHGNKRYQQNLVKNNEDQK